MKAVKKTLVSVVTYQYNYNYSIRFLSTCYVSHKKVQLNVRENSIGIRNRHFREPNIIGYKTENENKQNK